MSHHLQEFRRRQAARGHKRVEVSVSAEDAALVRRVAHALSGGGPAADALRQVIEKSVPLRRAISFKEWLAEPSED